MIETDLGCVTAYADAVKQGYTGTREEFGKVMANFADSAAQVAQDKVDVESAKQSIVEMQSDVTQKQKDINEQAEKARTSASEAEAAANSAKLSEQAVIRSEQSVNNTVTAFDSHVSEKIGEANNAVNAAKNIAVKAITDQQNDSVQEVKNQTAEYISDRKQEANLDITSHTTTKIQELDVAADTAKNSLDASTTIGNNTLQSLQNENASASSNLEELRSENFNSQEILAGVADLRAYLGLSDDDILGLQVDYRNKTFKRLAGATNLTPGTDFDKFSMYGGRRRCNVADDGTINAWYGDESYTEDGSNGQVMVYQPKFYYLVCPVVYDPIDTGIGYHLRKANYYVSEKPRPGFRLHPAFYDVNGNEIDYFLTSADEGSVYDVSASAYLLQDEQVLNAAEDKFCSISGARPASGYSQNLTRTSVEQLAQNRGANWHGDLIKQVSAEQLLMIIEMGVMELQTPIGLGVVNIPWETGDNKTCSYAAVTGSTSSIGNGTGRAAKSTVYPGNVATEYTDNGKTSICWRGKENFWGNIWKFVYGVNIWGNGKMAGGQPYICKDFNFAENKNSDNYEAAGFTVAAKAGYISAMGYSTKCDWLFMASECLGNSALPVGDYTYITELLNGYRIAPLGGDWAYGVNAGPFCWTLHNGVGYRTRSVGGRLVYIPTKDSAVYNVAIASWKEQMAS